MIKKLLYGSSSLTGCGKHDWQPQENQGFCSMGYWEVLGGALWATEEVLGDTGLVFHTFTQLTGMFDFLRGFPEGFTVSPAALRAAILDSMSET